MRVQLLLGPAGSGKTFRCLTEARQALVASPEGLPLLIVAPKQTTYQLERQLLSLAPITGYTRLQILSFDRLARFVLELLRQPPPRMLDDEGRVMVLRGLLTRRRQSLKLFRASARLTGFAQQLSQVLREFQCHQFTPDALRQLSAHLREEGLTLKLDDLATLLREYLDWLAAHGLQDAESLLDAARMALEQRYETTGASPRTEAPIPTSTSATPRRKTGGSRKCSPDGQLDLFAGKPSPSTGNGDLSPSRPAGGLSAPSLLSQIWVDGFAEFSPHELDLLVGLTPACEKMALTLCLDEAPSQKGSWLSSWSVVRRAFEQCHRRFSERSGSPPAIETIQRAPAVGRFMENPVLAHLERHWAEPKAWEGSADVLAKSLRVVCCANPEAEAVEAAREILNHVRAGGRYRDAAVLVRRLEGYHEILERTLTRYEIPFFLDRRESVAHHPLAELTRNALRTIAFGWKHEDWFAALKTGLTSGASSAIDELENEALARGWEGDAWNQPLRIKEAPRTEADEQGRRDLETRLETLRQEAAAPFFELREVLSRGQDRVAGSQLAAGLRQFWTALNVEGRLRAWTEEQPRGGAYQPPVSVHATVWEQMNAWLDNVVHAFAEDSLHLREWLPVLEAGLANLTVGVIPPALDNVLIGAVDRSRNPDLKLTIVLGVSESVFPATPAAAVLLTEGDRAQLSQRNVPLTVSAREHLGRERHLAYAAFTRARERLVLTHALQDGFGSPLNPSPFLTHLQRLFPNLVTDHVPTPGDWRQSAHPIELLPALMQGMARREQQPAAAPTVWPQLAALPALAGILDGMRHLREADPNERLTPAAAAELYGPVLRTSVSRLENFGACPFKFFVHSGLRAEERKRFELDAREQGSFQHDVLAAFHDQLKAEAKSWRDITPEEARERVGRIALSWLTTFHDGLLNSSVESRFTARLLTESLQDFTATLVGWMRGQYRFDPVAAELSFGENDPATAPTLDLGEGHTLVLRGRIDRVDLHRLDEGQALCVVVDYKSSARKLDAVLMACGLQLQLPAYLNVLRRWPDPRPIFGVGQLIPAGVFYVNLRGKALTAENRREALENPDKTRKLAYRHAGRFEVSALRWLDSRKDAITGDQFNYRLTQSGEISKMSREALQAPEFSALLNAVESSLKRMGQEIFAGTAAVSPFRKGWVVACRTCDYASICRFDQWLHPFRMPKSQSTAPQSK